MLIKKKKGNIKKIVEVFVMEQSKDPNPALSGFTACGLRQHTTQLPGS
jgi:hypothetical protein